MADPRFYDNRGPFALADVCRHIGADLPADADGGAEVLDVAPLDAAGRGALTFFADGKAGTEFSASGASFCLTPVGLGKAVPPVGAVLIACASVPHAFAAVANLFYPDAERVVWRQDAAVHPSAEIGEGVSLAPGVVIGPGAQVGRGTNIGPNTVIGRGVAIGRDCEIAGNVSIIHALIGDRVMILPGAQIGQSGFRFANAATGHTRVPQLGRVIVQDAVEIGACCTVDRGALDDTVIGEGTKIDNLVQVAHNVHIGRHCIVVSQTGFAGSAVVGDFVVLGGQSGIADHTVIGNGARLAGRTGMVSGQKIEGGQDYGGVPAKPVMDWMREMHAVAGLIKKRKAEQP